MPATKKHSRTLEEVRSEIARNLKRHRHAKGLAQETLALEAGVDRTMVSKIERGVTNPSIATLLKLSNRLEVDLVDVFQFEADRQDN